MYINMMTNAIDKNRLLNISAVMVQYFESQHKLSISTFSEY
jgi:hypothetical protein